MAKGNKAPAGNADDNKIRYSDFIEPDGSIENAIDALKNLDIQFTRVAEHIKEQSISMAKTLGSISPATSEGKKAILELSSEAEKLDIMNKRINVTLDETKKAYKTLLSISGENLFDYGTQFKNINKLKKEVDSLYDTIKKSNADVGSEAFDALYKKMGNFLNELHTFETDLKSIIAGLQQTSFDNSSFNDLQKQYRTLIEAYKALSPAEAEAFGPELIARATEVYARMQKINEEIDKTKGKLTDLEKAEKKLAFAQSDENKQLIQLTEETKRANKIAELQVRIANSAEGSYDRLSAQYELNKIKLNAMSTEERHATQKGKELEEETRKIYERMKQLQEVTGKNTLNVGNYGRVWDGLGYSVSQVVRELPAATVSLNTFFLAISNNIPMVVDEINKLKRANEAAIANGQKAKSVAGTIAKSIFSWQTALVIGLSIFSKYGQQIIEQVGLWLRLKLNIDSTKKSLKEFTTEMTEQNKSVAKNLALLQELQIEYNLLKQTGGDLSQMIKDRKKDFDALNVTIKTATDLERLLVEETGHYVQAMMYRAAADAARNKNAEAFEKILDESLKLGKKQNELDRLQSDKESKTPTTTPSPSYLATIATLSTAGTPGVYTQVNSIDLKIANVQRQIKNSKQRLAELKKQVGYYTELSVEFAKLEKKEMDALGLEKKHAGGGSSRESDLTTYIENMSLRVKKLRDDLVEFNEYDPLAKQFTKIKNDYEETAQEITKIQEQNRAKLEKEHKALTSRQVALLEKANAELEVARIENEKKYLHQLQMYYADVRIAELKQLNETEALKLEATRENTEENFQLQLAMLKNNKEIELAENSKLTDREKKSEADIIAKWNKKIEDLEQKHRNAMLNIRKTSNDLLIDTTLDSDFRHLAAELDNISIEYTKAINENALLEGTEAYMNPMAILAKYQQKAYAAQVKFYDKVFSLQQDLDKALFDETVHSSLQITLFQNNQERERIQQKLKLYKAGLLQLSDQEVETYESTLRKLDRLDKEAIEEAFSNGLEYGFLSMLGFDDKSIQAFDAAKQYIMDSLNELLEAEIEIAQKEIKLQQAKVDAAQTAYEAEVTARANGYANNVIQARRELQLQQNLLRKKQQNAEKYQKAQQAIDSATQASSLVTATANIWSTMTSAGIAGVILAAIATAGMFTAFIAAKIKAAQLTSTYGEGGLEFLQGGSHASGHDIDLGINNSEGKRMRAEGGEAVAVINKRKTRKYKSLLPSIVDSLNDGTFEKKFVGRYNDANNIVLTSKTDLSTLEKSVNSLVKNSVRQYIDAGDRVIIIEGNTKRIIRK